MRKRDKKILNWFCDYAGDVIPNEDYQRLVPQLARLLTGKYYDSVDEVLLEVHE